MCLAQPYYFRNYQVNNGLSSNTITCITQDADGFMWFGTRNGLNRFDGTGFKTFRNKTGDEHSIGSNSVLSLFVDKHRQLWVGTYKGLYRYDARHESFSLFSKIPLGEVRSIGEDNSNNLWVIDNQVLYELNESTNTITIRNNLPSAALSVDGNGNVWFASSNKIIRRYNPAKNTFSEYDIDKLNKYGQPAFIQTIYPVTDSTALVATLRNVFLLNTKAKSLDNVFKNLKGKAIQVHKIIEQSAGTFWLGTENGLYILNLHENTNVHIKKQYADPYSIDDNVITDFCKDKEGNTWIGTFFGGVNYYSRQLSQFQKYFPLPETNSLSGNLVHEICSDDNNNLWIGTEDAGLNKLDPKTGLFKNFMPGKAKGDISYQNIHGLLADGNELWIGTYEHGLDVMDLRTEKVIRHYEKSNKANSLNSNFIVTLYKTREGDILAGTWNGLFKYDRFHDDFIPLPFFNRQAQAIHEDENGTLWVCSYGNGVYYYNERTGLKGNYQYNPSDSNSLTNNYVNNLFEDNKHNIWFCTESGLCYLDAISKKIIRCNSVPELRENQVFKVLQDDKGLLWISTSKGLVSLNPASRQVKTYDSEYGLLSDQFNYNSGFKNKNGRLYFGTVKGMISFDPASLVENKIVPPVYLTGIQINNHDPDLYDSASPLKETIEYAKKIVLPYNSSNITIEAAALSYSMPALNAYRYKMKGVDKEWTTIETNRKIYYTKLPPGQYTFMIKGSNGDKLWNNHITELSIKVLPPWWGSWWAYILYVLTVLGIAFIIFRYYHLAMREKNHRLIKTLEIEKEREVYNSKIEFFTNITHEIRTPLTLIKLPVEKLLKSSSKDAKLQEHLTMIEKNTNRLIHLTNQLLDFRKAEANNYTLSFVRTDVNDLLRQLFVTYKPIAEEKKLSFRLEMPRIPLLAYVDAEALRKIIGNLLSNAIKYADHFVAVKLSPFSSEDNLFHIEFRNDGFIIPYDLKDKIFEPFFRLKETEKMAGTGIGLPLARSLAELHKGKLELKQPVDNYNLFLLSIPFHQEMEIDLDDYETIESNFGEEEPDENPNLQSIHDTSILIVEDNREITRFLQKELHTQYNIYSATDGREALEILSQRHIDLVISDIMMPVMDGIELSRCIKTNIEYSHIPIILLTAKNTVTSKIEGLENGADAYIEKPFVMEHLLAQINSLLSNRNHIKEYYAHSPLAHIRGVASTKADTTFLEELQKVIDENLIDKDLDVEMLSRMMNMSRSSFYRKIKGLINLTPNELICISRLKKAAELLAKGKYKINEVAMMVGYDQPGNFSRDFNKQFGVTPTHYVNNIIGSA